jgi:hypothetical protein
MADETPQAGDLWMRDDGERVFVVNTGDGPVPLKFVFDDGTIGSSRGRDCRLVFRDGKPYPAARPSAVLGHDPG